MSELTQEEQANLSAANRDLGRIFAEVLDDEEYAAMFSPEGLARSVSWQAEDGWIIDYTTTRIRASAGGRNDGKFAVAAYKPVGKGARTGKATTFKRVYFRTFARRKSARKRAEELYAQHSPRWAGKEKAQADD